MSEQKPPEENITDELRRLGQNLAEVLRSAWDSPERKRLQQEVENGMRELGSTLKKEADHLSESPAGQRIRSDVSDLRERIRSGEAEAKIREEIVGALRMINTELQKATSRRTGQDTDAPAEPDKTEFGDQSNPPPEGRSEIHPDDVESTSPNNPQE